MSLPPIPLTADTTDQQITANVLDTLRAAQVGGVPLFDRVTECESAQDFFRYSQPTKGAVCGVQVLRSERNYGMSNYDLYNARLPLNVVVGNYYIDPINGDVTPAVQRAQSLLDLARAALLKDPTRGGLASVLMWGGKILEATSVNAAPQLIQRRAKTDPVYFAFVLPVFVGYAKPRS